MTPLKLFDSGVSWKRCDDPVNPNYVRYMMINLVRMYLVNSIVKKFEEK